MFDESKGAVSIISLLKFVEKNEKIFNNGLIVKQVLKRQNERLDFIKPKLYSLNKHRNNEFIHKSNEYLQRGFEALHAEYSITNSDFEEIFNMTEIILKDYWSLLGKKEFTFERPGEEEEFSNLKKYLRKGIATIRNENQIL